MRIFAQCCISRAPGIRFARSKVCSTWECGFEVQLKELMADDGVVSEDWGYHWLTSKQDFGVVGSTLGNVIRTVQDVRWLNSYK